MTSLSNDFKAFCVVYIGISSITVSNLYVPLGYFLYHGGEFMLNLGCIESWIHILIKYFQTLVRHILNVSIFKTILQSYIIYALE